MVYSRPDYFIGVTFDPTDRTAHHWKVYDSRPWVVGAAWSLGD